MCFNARQIQSQRAISGVDVSSLQFAGRRARRAMLGPTSYVSGTGKSEEDGSSTLGSSNSLEWCGWFSYDCSEDET